jgi:hypothetical protein
VFNERLKRGFWDLAVVERRIKDKDGVITCERKAN